MVTYVVECYWPGVTESAHAAAAARAKAAAESLTSSGLEVDFLGSELFPGDEVVFYRFSANSIREVEEASTLARLPYERIVDYVEAPDPEEGPASAG